MKHLDTEALQNEALRILHQVHPKNMTYDQWLGAGAAYKHALVERDTGSLEHQVETIHQLRLPVTATIYSGDKSAHAAVRVDAADQKQYCERVAFLHDYCTQHNLEIDLSCTNPSCMMRLAGATCKLGWNDELCQLGAGSS